jgi:hypothetical protein
MVRGPNSASVCRRTAGATYPRLFLRCVTTRLRCWRAAMSAGGVNGTPDKGGQGYASDSPSASPLLPSC